MDRSVAFYLLSETRTQDAIGQWITTTEKRQVFGQITSVTASEFFAGGQNGFQPEYRIVMFAPDYEGEENLEYNGETFSIYRRYQGRNDRLELYVEKRRGDQPETEDENDNGQP